MAWMKLIAPGAPVEIKFSAGEHAALLNLAQSLDKQLLEQLRHSPTGRTVRFSLAEWEQLATHVSRAANHVGDAKVRKHLRQAFDKVVRVLETYTDEDDDQAELLPNGLIEAGTPLHLLSELFGNPTNAGPTLDINDAMAAVRLTEEERAILLRMDTISGDIHKQLAGAGKGEQTLHFNPRQVIVIGLAISEELTTSISVKRQCQLEAIVERLGQGMIEIPGMPEVFGPMPLGSELETLPVCFRVKIELEGSRPTIWRRIEIADCSLLELHEAIQGAMGWQNCHMHAFQVGKQYYGQADLEDSIDETTMSLSQLFDQGTKKLRYWYDFGDDWWHAIKLEKQFDPAPRAGYPRCTAGARACPPEDCGGIWGYEEMLTALKDPAHERHEEFQEWCVDFDSEKFSLDQANSRLSGARR